MEISEKDFEDLKTYIGKASINYLCLNKDYNSDTDWDWAESEIQGNLIKADGLCARIERVQKKRLNEE